MAVVVVVVVEVFAPVGVAALVSWSDAVAVINARRRAGNLLERIVPMLSKLIEP